MIWCTQDYLKTVVPSQLLAERGSNLVVINPGFVAKQFICFQSSNLSRVNSGFCLRIFILILWVDIGSANIRIGLAQQDAPISVPHCIARRTSQLPKKNVQDQVIPNSQILLNFTCEVLWFLFMFYSFFWFLFFSTFGFVMQLLNSQVTTAQHMERERAYDIVSWKT